MKVIHSGSCNILAGGPALSTYLTIKGLRNEGVDARLIMEPIIKGNLINDKLQPYYTSHPIFGSLAYVPKLKELLKRIGLPNLYHIQGIWMLHGFQISKYARKYHIPYIVTLRGMLYPQALNHKKLVKRLSLYAYQNAVLRNAAVIQATCIEEMEYYRALGFTNPVAVLPNPIEVSYPIVDKLGGEFTFGYLGRLHKRKRVERLIYAMNTLKDRLPLNSKVVIIGGGDDEYEAFLKSEVQRLNLDQRVEFKGFLSGKDKFEAIRKLSVLVVPSDFENFGNIVTEALSLQIPVIASKGMPWQELVEEGCGWWIDNDQNSITNTIWEAYCLGEEKLSRMGIKGQTLVKNNYSVESLGKKMVRLYQWVINGGEVPEFVYMINDGGKIH